MQIQLPFRAQTWWRHIVPPILSLLYLLAYLGEVSFESFFAPKLGLFVAAILPFAAWGYYLNDLCDIGSDARSGKSNFAAKLPLWLRIPILILLSGLAVLPWFFIEASPLIHGALGLQALVLTLYSVPPIRLKERGMAGLACDMSYGHINPLFITFILFAPLQGPPPLHHGELILTFLLLWAFFKGLRNIVLHQIEDRKKDRQGGVRTFVRQYGPLPSLHMLHSFVVPIEILIFSILLIILAVLGVKLYLFFGLFLLLTSIKFSVWKLPSLPRKQRWFKFLYFLNDFYEDWMPLGLLILLSLGDPQYLYLLGLHLLFFPGILLNLMRDLQLVMQNLKDKN